MKILTQSGIGGFFDRYSATGGISEGKLGGVSNVRPDYKTDLTITFVPFSYETLYLRAYVGETYTGSSWEAPFFDRRIFERAFGEHLDDYEEYTAFLEARRLQHYTNTTKNAGIYGKMQIENVDANPNCLYLPYYTINSLSVPYQTTDSIVRGQLAKGSAMTLSYYPLLHNYWNIPAQPDALLMIFPEQIHLLLILSITTPSAWIIIWTIRTICRIISLSSGKRSGREKRCQGRSSSFRII